MNPWPELLLFLAGALKAGLSLEEAIRLAMRDAPEAIKKELKKRSGSDFEFIPLDKKIVRLFSDPQMALARAALLVTYETGAGQARILETCAKLIRERSEFLERVRTMTLQSRFTAWVVGLSPVFLLFALQLVSPDIVAPLFETRMGMRLLGGSALSVVVGLLIVHRMARIEP